MRTKDSPNLTKDKKAKIIAQKKVRLTTQKLIAEENGIAEQTVKQIERYADQETLDLAKDYEKEILADMKRTNHKLLKYLEETVDNKTLPPSAISTAFGTTFDKIQIKTGGPTQIIAQDTHVLTIYKWYISNGYTQEEAERQLMDEKVRAAVGVGEEEMRVLAAKVIGK